MPGFGTAVARVQPEAGTKAQKAKAQAKMKELSASVRNAVRDGKPLKVAGSVVPELGIIGEVTTVIQTQANNTKLTANPTTGTSVDLCTVLDITADEVGCLYGIDGTVGNALVGANAGYAPLPDRPLVVNAGTIDLDCAASNTGP